MLLQSSGSLLSSSPMTMRSTDGGTSSNDSLTYEAAKAEESTRYLADRVHWDPKCAYRGRPYRQLHHQRGVVGVFRIRLLEASDLRRSYWSALALGPVKHLGLSKAHGAVSSYCAFSLECQPRRRVLADSDQRTAARKLLLSSSQRRKRQNDNNNNNNNNNWDKKPAAKSGAGATSSSSIPVFTSPVVPSDNNPVWENCQFECALRKGMTTTNQNQGGGSNTSGGRGDGQRILLKIRVDEDSTAVENLIPGPGARGKNGGNNARLLGVGQLDLTELCLGETSGGQCLPGVRDAWVPITLRGQDVPDDEDDEEDDDEEYDSGASASASAASYDRNDPLAPPPSNKDKKRKSVPRKKPSPDVTGSVRVLVSYQPYGLEPQAHDVVALEAFARRNPATATCRPLLPPLLPMTVLERRGAYLLAEYSLWDRRKACVRIHRNSVFVIERKNAVDAAHNLALLPFDAVKSTPLGQATGRALGPAVAASKEILMPALLSMKLVWMAARTTTLAGFSGVQALGSTLWSEGTGSLTASHRQSQELLSLSSSSSSNNNNGNGNNSRQRYNYEEQHRRDSRSATAQFISL